MPLPHRGPGLRVWAALLGLGVLAVGVAVFEIATMRLEF
jgi:hypothetical protein